MNNVTTVKECIYCVNHHCIHPYYNGVNCESYIFCDLYKTKDNMINIPVGLVITVTTLDEDKELRKILHDNGYTWCSGNSLLELTYFEDGHSDYRIETGMQISNNYGALNKIRFNEFKQKYMETKELKITPPEGYIIDTENSTFECVKFKKKELVYKDIISKLYKNKEVYSVDAEGNIGNPSFVYTNGINSVSKKQLEKILAINKLMNVAKYLNDNWKPDWNNGLSKYYINIKESNISIGYVRYENDGLVYFKTEKLAQQAIDILGEDTIRLALSTDW